MFFDFIHQGNVVFFFDNSFKGGTYNKSQFRTLHVHYGINKKYKQLFGMRICLLARTSLTKYFSISFGLSRSAQKSKAIKGWTYSFEMIIIIIPLTTNFIASHEDNHWISKVALRSSNVLTLNFPTYFWVMMINHRAASFELSSCIL